MGVGHVQAGVGERKPTPALLARKDFSNGGSWDIQPCAAERGQPWTNMHDKEMRVPMNDNELSRVIRAHEMMHAKATPMNMGDYLARAQASRDSIIAAEEARVNFLIKKAGFDTTALVDKSDMEGGEILAKMKDWAGLVRTTAATTGLGGWAKFIVGVKKVNPDWASDLKDVHRNIQQTLRDAWKRGDLASTREEGVGFIRGFIYTEHIARFMDEIIEAGERQMEKDAEEADPARQNKDAEEKRQDENAPKPRRETQKPLEEKRPLPKKDEGGTNKNRRGWANVVEEHFAMNAASPGGIGYKKVPSNRGRNPRRITRALIDPHRRIFDHKVKSGKGGIILVDTSGSMHLDIPGLKALLEASPGCTVAAYSLGQGNGRVWDDEPNLFVLAEKGRMVSEIAPTVLQSMRDGEALAQRTNGNDGTAIQWALDRAKSGEPIVWVTDFGVHYGHHSFVQEARRGMLNILKANPKITVRNDVGEAIEFLRTGKGEQPWRLTDK